MSFSFRPNPPDKQDYSIMYKDIVIGNLYWKLNHPKPEDKVAIIRNLHGNIGLCSNEQQAIIMIIKWEKEHEEPVNPVHA